MNIESKLSISQRQTLGALVLLGIIWIVCFYGATLILPLLVAVLIATLLDQPTKFFNRIGFPHWLAITISVLAATIILLLLFWLISFQVEKMAGDWLIIKEKAIGKFRVFSGFMKSTFQIDVKHIIGEEIDFRQRLEIIARALASSLSTLLAQSFLVLVYVVLFLMQKQMFIIFFKKLFKNYTVASTIILKSKATINNYLLGKSKIICFLFVIYYLGFLAGQVPFALFLALFAALFSIIPFVGNLIGGGAAIILAFLYSGGTPAIIVIAVLTIAQLAENYILTPWIIGDEINLNPFITVFGVIFFSTLWGVVGAIIALPILGILKVFFEHTHDLEAYAYLLKQHKT